MRIVVNDSPLAGREGKFLTARHLKERLVRESRQNVSIAVKDTDTAGVFEISARGEMQIAILVEQMRREGYELLVSRPEVIFQRDEAGNLLEPIETLYVDVPNENLGDILQSLAARKAEITNMEHQTHSVLVEAVAPTRGLIGFETDLVNLTKGHGIMSHLFKEYAPFRGELTGRNNGVLVAMEAGIATAYALNNIQERGRLFIGPQEEVYEGMIVGENSRPGRPRGEPVQGQTPHQHAQPGRRQGHPARSRVQDEPRTLARIHRPRRVCGGHAQEPAAPQENPRHERTQTGRQVALRRPFASPGPPFPRRAAKSRLTKRPNFG